MAYEVEEGTGRLNQGFRSTTYVNNIPWETLMEHCEHRFRYVPLDDSIRIPRELRDRVVMVTRDVLETELASKLNPNSDNRSKNSLQQVI
jgi:hypothetical protein